MNSENDIEKLVGNILARISSETESKLILDLCLSKKIAEKAIEKSKDRGINVVISIVDSHGNLILLNRMENALLASIELSMKKAYTSVALKMPTSEVLNHNLHNIVESMGGKIVTFGGGIPIIYNGKIIGGIGVSGGSVEEDIEIAKHSINAVFK